MIPSRTPSVPRERSERAPRDHSRAQTGGQVPISAPQINASDSGMANMIQYTTPVFNGLRGSLLLRKLPGGTQVSCGGLAVLAFADSGWDGPTPAARCVQGCSYTTR